VKNEMRKRKSSKKSKETVNSLPPLASFNDLINGKINQRRQIYKEMTKKQKVEQV
jgi:hypothetical protein